MTEQIPVDRENFQHAVMQLNAALRDFNTAVDTLMLARGQLNRTLSFLIEATQLNPSAIPDDWCIECGGEHEDPCCHR
jgi:hypothetical protein